MTRKGKELGKFLLERHKVIETFLEAIGTKENILRKTELIEHHISVATMNNLRLFSAFMKKSPHIHRQFIEFKKENEG